MKNRIAVILVIMIVTGCGGGILTDQLSDYDGLIESGWERYNQRRYDEAYQLFLQAKRQDAERPEAYIGSGWSLLRRQQPDSAVVVFRTGFTYIDAYADSVDTVCGLSGSYLAGGENEKVIELFKKYTFNSYEEAFPLEKHDFFLDEFDLELVQAMACYRLGLYSTQEKEDPDNATFHLNNILVKPVEYTNPKTLMETLLDYIEETEGEIPL